MSYLAEHGTVWPMVAGFLLAVVIGAIAIFLFRFLASKLESFIGEVDTSDMDPRYQRKMTNAEAFSSLGWVVAIVAAVTLTIVPPAFLANLFI